MYDMLGGGRGWGVLHARNRAQRNVTDQDANTKPQDEPSNGLVREQGGTVMNPEFFTHNPSSILW